MTDVYGSRNEFTYNGITTQYYIFGNGPKVLFFHGLGATPITYRSVLLPLSKYYTLIVPQIPPFGYASTLPATWTLKKYTEYFQAFMTQLELHTIPIVGHSYGGAITFSLAGVLPDIPKVVVINPMGVPCLTTWQQICTSVVFGSVLGFFVGKETLKPLLIGDFFSGFLRHPRSLTHSLHIIRGICSTPDIDFSTIHQPVSVLWGRNEELFPSTYLEDLRRLLPQVSVTEIDGYHNWLFFHPDTFVNQVRRELGNSI